MSIKFKVWRRPDNSNTAIVAEHVHGDQYYAHVLFGNGKIVWASEGYKDVRSAFNVCQKTWDNIRKAFGVENLSPVPYTRDSLMPKGEANALTARKIKRATKPR